VIVCVHLEEEELVTRLAFIHFGLEHVHDDKDAVDGYKKKLGVRYYIQLFLEHQAVPWVKAGHSHSGAYGQVLGSLDARQKA
jgi:hypothetical protein